MDLVELQPAKTWHKLRAETIEFYSLHVEILINKTIAFIPSDPVFCCLGSVLCVSSVGVLMMVSVCWYWTRDQH